MNGAIIGSCYVYMLKMDKFYASSTSWEVVWSIYCAGKARKGTKIAYFLLGKGKSWLLYLFSGNECTIGKKQLFGPTHIWKRFGSHNAPEECDN